MLRETERRINLPARSTDTIQCQTRKFYKKKKKKNRCHVVSGTPPLHDITYWRLGHAHISQREVQQPARDSVPIACAMILRKSHDSGLESCLDSSYLQS